ncbi:hypothetical protein BGP77_06450 [Saccharospirillum sp. MSK14-1]|uniref:hypothetical protein n=1 Tax=Saccharospirillum sp. MSK14-1 TaxID=1897632 RepID=UPI000D339FE7|nr:hypothetical protein [Saccharospirillum sp. MSK14-1]PTY36921.1 hypothetical protein BGP77_06450 [Saccharospirillum sp. MSK14-1]
MAVTAEVVVEASSSLVFLRRQQVADMIVELSFNEAARQRLPQLKGLLIDSLQQLPEACFIADDWTEILSQVVQALMNPSEHGENRLPAHLQCAIGQLQRRLQ